MNPENVNPPLLLQDGEPTQCRFWAAGDPPTFMERCETLATVALTDDELVAWDAWHQENPRAIIHTLPGRVHLCDTHRRVIGECIG